jgi:hypothetical protein
MPVIIRHQQAGPPRFFLVNCRNIIKPYGWLSFADLVYELRDLDEDIYGNLGGPEAALWLAELGVPFTPGTNADGEEVLGVAFHHIDAEIRRRRAAARRART